jgi:hypothetical protein
MGCPPGCPAGDVRHLVIIFGPPAVGKMAVGKVLAGRTGLKLFHNHMALEPVLQIFPFGSDPFNRLVRRFRDDIFQEVAASALPGLIYTCMWDLDSELDRAYIDQLCSLFRSHGAAAHFVELHAPLEERLRRNRTELRLHEKPSKRDIEASEQRLRAREQDRRMNSNTDFFYPAAHIRIDSCALAPEKVASIIIERFGLPAGGAARLPADQP